MTRRMGSWRIVEMDLWDRDAIDLVGPAFIELGADGTGCFRFIAVEGHLDCRYAERGDSPGVELPGKATTKGDRASGRGWAQLEADGSLLGHIFFHAGDDSGFRGVAHGEASERAS